MGAASNRGFKRAFTWYCLKKTVFHYANFWKNYHYCKLQKCNFEIDFQASPGTTSWQSFEHLKYILKFLDYSTGYLKQLYLLFTVYRQDCKLSYTRQYVHIAKLLIIITHFFLFWWIYVNRGHSYNIVNVYLYPFIPRRRVNKLQAKICTAL